MSKTTKTEKTQRTRKITPVEAFRAVDTSEQAQVRAFAAYIAGDRSQLTAGLVDWFLQA